MTDINSIEKLLNSIYNKIYDYDENKKYQNDLMFYNNIKHIIITLSNTYVSKLHDIYCKKNCCICDNLIILKEIVEYKIWCTESIKNEMSFILFKIQFFLMEQ